MSEKIKVIYNADTPETSITVNGEPFDTSRIKGKEIEDWAYPFMMRKVKWNGFYDEMVEALGGKKEFEVVFEGSDEALAELKESLEDAPVSIIKQEPVVVNIVDIEYDAGNLTTKITVNGQPFDTSRIDGKEIEDWIYPFMMRKVKWDGIFEELSKVAGETYTIRLSGADTAVKELEEESPDGVTIETVKTAEKVSLNKSVPETESTSDEAYELEEQAQQSQNEGNMEEAFKLRLKAADMGNVISLSNLGWHYQYGNGVEQDYKKAFKYYKQAADKGNAWSQNKVGFMYNNGYGCAEDEGKAFEYFMKAAEQDFAEGQYWVGMCYKNGWGVNQDYTQACAWFADSADSNYVCGWRETGLCAYNGLGCEKDDEFAKQCWLYAEEQDDAESMDYLGEMELDRENYDRAFELFRRSYELGYRRAATDLSLCYENGFGTPKDYRMAVRVLEENVDEYPEYYVQLGKIFFPLGTPYQNYARAVQYFQKAVDNELVEGYFMLGLCYSNGWGVTKDKERAKQLLQVAMDNGHEDAATAYNDIVKTEGYWDTAKKVGGGLLKALGTIGGAYLNSTSQYGGYDDDDDDYY